MPSQLNQQTLNPVWTLERDRCSENEGMTFSTLAEMLGVKDEAELWQTWLRRKIVYETNTAGRFAFSYVGVIQYGSKLVYCLPKYWRWVNPPEKNEVRKSAEWSHFAQVLKVIARYRESVDEQAEDTQEHEGDGLLGLMVRLVMDYAENGVYRDDEQVEQINGNGKILWQKSINSLLPYLQNGRDPVYVDLYRRATVADEDNYFARLHRFVVKECCLKLQECGMLDLLDLPIVNDSEEELDVFGARAFIKYCLETELLQQFDSRRRFILQKLLEYLGITEHQDDSDQLFLFGTTSFEHVWEEVCRATLGRDCHEEEKWKAPFKESAPCWQLGMDKDEPFFGKPHRLDMLFWNEEAKRLELYDAKYYVPDYNPKGKYYSGLPGIGDISKQYLYRLTLKPHCPESFSVHNALLLPAPHGTTPGRWGTVSMKILADMGLGDIDVYRLNPEKLYTRYLDGTQESLSKMS